MQHSEITELIGRMKGYFVTWQAPAGADAIRGFVAAWGDFLTDLPTPEVVAVLRSYAARGETFPPNPGTLRNLVLANRHGAPPDVDQAFAELSAGISHWGHNRWDEVAWTHPAIGETIRGLGGWLEVCKSENPEALRAHFMRLYAIASRRHLVDATPDPDRDVLRQARGAPIELPAPVGTPADAEPDEPVVPPPAAILTALAALAARQTLPTSGRPPRDEPTRLHIVEPDADA